MIKQITHYLSGTLYTNLFPLGVCFIFLLFILKQSVYKNNESKQTSETNVQKHARKEKIPWEENGETPNEDEALPVLPENLEHVPYVYEKLSDQEMTRRSEQFYEAMQSRRSIRFFSQESVPIEVIRNIVKTAGTSPSGAHTEPWTFVVIHDLGVKRQVREVVEEEEYINYTRRMGKQWTADLRPFKTNWEKEYLTDAPYLILVFKQLFSYTETGQKKNHYYNEISVAIAAGIMLMAIHNAGLVTLTSTPLQCGSRLRDILGRPESEKLMLLFPVGKPSKECTVPDLKRKSFEEICVEI